MLCCCGAVVASGAGEARDLFGQERWGSVAGVEPQVAPPPPPRAAAGLHGRGLPAAPRCRAPSPGSVPPHSLPLLLSLSPGRGRSSGWQGARPLPSRAAAAASSGGAVRRRSRAGPRRRGGGHEHGCVRRARRIRRRPRWRTPAARLGLWGARRRSPRPRATRDAVLAYAPLLPLSLLSLCSVSSGWGRARPRGAWPAAGGSRLVGRTAVAVRRSGVDCGLISENFRGLFENKFERGEWTAGCISRKFEDFYAK